MKQTCKVSLLFWWCPSWPPVCRPPSPQTAAPVPPSQLPCFWKDDQIILLMWDKGQYESIKITSRLLPVSDVDRHQVVEVQTAPLIDILRAGGTEESPAHLCPRTGQKDGGELLPEARLTAFKQLIGLIDHQPLHAEQQHNTTINVPFYSRFLLTVESGDRDRKWEKEGSGMTQKIPPGVLRLFGMHLKL